MREARTWDVWLSGHGLGRILHGRFLHGRCRLPGGRGADGGIAVPVGVLRADSRWITADNETAHP